MRLLVVEDDERMITLLKRALEEDGYAVDVTGDGVEATEPDPGRPRRLHQSRPHCHEYLLDLLH